MEEESLLQRARDAIQARKVPSQRPNHIRGGRGNGDVCTICGESFPPKQTGFDVEFIEEAGKVRYAMHLRCFSAWDQAREECPPG